MSGTARSRAGRWALAVAVFSSAMALGATYTAILLGVVAPLTLATWLIWSEADPLRPRSAASILFWTSLLITGWTLLQTVPMPMGWLKALDPNAADTWSRALLPLREAGPSWATASLDPLATRVEVVRGVAYLLAFLSAVRIATHRQGAVFLEGILLATGLAVAVAAWVHPALGADKVFGLYRPLRNPGARHIAPILNSNVLSGYLNIALAIAFSHAVVPRSRLPRSIAAALTAFLVATQLWIASRGGMLGTVFALILVVWMTRAPSGERSRSRVLIPATLIAAGVAMVVLVSSEDAWQELASADVSKLRIAFRALYLIPLFPLFGVGRGAFESTFPRVRDDTGSIVYTHPENVIAQWATEWGPVVALLAGGAILFALRPRSALLRSARATGAWAALAAVGLQNLVDFSSEYPGVVIALTVCAAIVAGGTGGVDSRSFFHAWARAPRRLAALGVVASALAVALGLTCLGGELFRDRLALRRDALDPVVSRDAFRAEIRAAMLRHPAEPYVPFTGGLRALRTRDESVVGWVERTLELAPVYGPAHLLLARALAVRSPAQSRLEYRLAVEQAPELGGAVLAEVLHHISGYDEATDLITHGRGRATWLDLLVTALGAKLPATAARLDADLAEVDPASEAVARRRAVAVLDDLAQDEAAPWCWDDRPRCVERALSLTLALQKLTPGRCDGYSLHARAEIAGGDTGGAIKELQAAAARVSDRTTCLRELATTAYRARSGGVLDETLDQLAHAGCSSDKECEADLLWVADFEVTRGNPHRALALLHRAHERNPTDDDLLDRIGDLAASVGLHSEALRAFEELARHHPDDARWKARAAREKDALLRDSVRL